MKKKSNTPATNLAFSLIISRTHNIVEAIGMFELMKFVAKDFADSKQFVEWKEKIINLVYHEKYVAPAPDPSKKATVSVCGCITSDTSVRLMSEAGGKTQGLQRRESGCVKMIEIKQKNYGENKFHWEKTNFEYLDDIIKFLEKHNWKIKKILKKDKIHLKLKVFKDGEEILEYKVRK